MKFLGLLLGSVIATFEEQENAKVTITDFQCDGAFVMSMNLQYAAGDGRADTKPGNWGCKNVNGNEHSESADFSYDQSTGALSLDPYKCARGGGATDADGNDLEQPTAAGTTWGSEWNTGLFHITWNAQFLIPGTTDKYVHVARYNIPVSCTYKDSYAVTADTAVMQKTSTTSPAQEFSVTDADFVLALVQDQSLTDSFRANDRLTAGITAKDNYTKLSTAMEFAPTTCSVTDNDSGTVVNLYAIDKSGAGISQCGLENLGWTLEKRDRTDAAGSANEWDFSYITFVMGSDLHETKHTYVLSCTIKVCNNANTGSDCSAAEACI